MIRYLAFLLISITPAAAQTVPTISVSPSQILPGGTLSVSMAGGPGNRQAYIELGIPGVPVADYHWGWVRLNGSQALPPVGLTAATVSIAFAAPPPAGAYEARLINGTNSVSLAAAPFKVLPEPPKPPCAPGWFMTSFTTCAPAPPAPMGWGVPSGNPCNIGDSLYDAGNLYTCPKPLGGDPVWIMTPLVMSHPWVPAQ